MGILVGVGLPSFRSMVINMRIKNASFDMHSILLAARNEAVTRNAEVTITPKSGTNWASGWNVTTNSGAVTLKTQDALTGVAILPKSTAPYNSAPYTYPLASIVYNSSGRLKAAVQPITLYASGASGSSVGRCITLDLSGRPATAKGVCP